MNKKAELLQLIPQQGILPLYFYKDTEVSLQVLKALYRAGIRTVEYTNRGEAALQNLKKWDRFAMKNYMECIWESARSKMLKVQKLLLKQVLILSSVRGVEAFSTSL
jgi:hypothetical protein